MTKKIKYSVIKRDGRDEKFDTEKIWLAITKAARESGEFDEKEAKRLAKIVKKIIWSAHLDVSPNVEQIQDVVEQVVMAAGYYQTAKGYILYRAERKELREAKKQLGVWDDLGLKLNQLKVIERRYLLHDEDGRVVETPREWLMRVAETLAGVEKTNKHKWKQEFFEVMANFEFLPAGRTLNNAGTKQNQLANCFVLPVEDSMEGIFDAVKWTALIHQTGGGTGFNFSKLRPRGDAVTRAAGGFATGPVSFMKVFDVATRQVMQGGKKRGANMGILNVDHPDIMEFVTCKTEEGEIANFNISVGITDEFMRAVEKDTQFPLKNPRTGEIVQRVSARTLFDQLATLAWRTGDPGLIFLDEINRNNPLKEAMGPIDATNPCGEQPLHPFDACNLGSINLAAFVKEGKVDWKRIREVTEVAVRMLDNVIDACDYPLPQIAETVQANRRIGMGVMGWADMLYQLRVGYGTEESVRLARKVMKQIQQASWEASARLAEEKGEFPRWENSAFAKGWDPIKKRMMAKKSKLWKVRNVAITTIAPTGSISMAADTSSGIEPVFALSYVKNVVDDAGLSYINPYFNQALDEYLGEDEREELLRYVARRGSIQGAEAPEQLTEVFVTAHDISWEKHVRMQAAFQAHVDNAVSKTINFPATASIEDVKGAYMLAWKLRCKGITVYRDSSKSYQVLSVSHDKKKPKKDDKYMIQSKIKTKTLKERAKAGLISSVEKAVCPECGSTMAIQEGCSTCFQCGYSKCSV